MNTDIPLPGTYNATERGRENKMTINREDKISVKHNSYTLVIQSGYVFEMEES